MLIEVWYHKVMNEKSIHAPFVPDKRKFCSARKLPGGRFPNKCGVKIVQPSKKESDGQKKGKKGLKMPQKAVQ